MKKTRGVLYVAGAVAASAASMLLVPVFC
jgi:hypothetical protein